DLKTTKLLCIGISAGGFAALRFGLRMKAAKILTVAPAVSHYVTDDLGDNRARLFVNRMYSLFDKADLDVSRDVRASEGSTQIEVWYGAKATDDAAHAQCLDGLPGVTLKPLKGVVTHSCLPLVIENGAI